MMIKQSECDNELREVLTENPDLPILVLSNDIGGGFDNYYHFVTDTHVEDMLFPDEVEKLYGDTYGLNPERWYSDLNEAQEDIEGWLWDFDHGSEYTKENGPQNQYFEWVKVYGQIAWMMAEDMPTHKYIVIRAEM